jgi:hypothetical protein
MQSHHPSPHNRLKNLFPSTSSSASSSSLVPAEINGRIKVWFVSVLATPGVGLGEKGKTTEKEQKRVDQNKIT